MVDELNNLVDRVEAEKGEVLLFMLWKSLPQDDTWSVIISAVWIDEMVQSVALQYWINKIRESLSKEDLLKINRVSLLRSDDRIVKLITLAISVTTAPIEFSKNQIADLYINEAVIFRSRKKKQRRFLTNQNRNPIFNHNINPIFNHNINPIFNHNINPIFNHNINPIFNHNINPIFNHNINPIFNHNINPIFNHNINPIFNHNINPIFNHNINPIFNPNFPGYYLYDDQVGQNGYFVYANEEIILLFNNDSSIQATGVKNSIDGFTLFDAHRHWLGTLIPDSQNGFLFYSKSNKKIGFVK